MVSNTYSVLNALSATPANNYTLSDHILSVTSCPPMDFRKIEFSKYTAAAAGTPGVYTVTPSATIVGTHNLAISQFVKALGKVVTVTLQYTAIATDNATSICNAWRAQLAAGNWGLSLVASGTATLVLTTTAPNNFLSVTSTGTNAATTVVSPSPVARVGNGSDLSITALGDLLGTTAIVTTNNYAAYEFVYGSTQEKSTAGENALQISKHILLVNTGDANFAAFSSGVNSLNQILAALSTTNVANPETVSVL